MELKSFKQYLLAEDMPEYQDGGSVRGHTVSPKIPRSKSTKLGNIGPYEVHHYKNATGYDDEMVSLHHDGKQVGQFTFYRGGRNAPIRIDFPTMAAAHRGKKALVKNLVPKVYGMIADKIGTVESGEQQTKGGRSIWTRLSKMRPVRIRRSSELASRSTSAEYFSHPNHPNLRLNLDQHADYEDIHSGIESGWATVRHAKTRLRELGMNKKVLARVKTVKDLPHPNDFKRKTINLSKMGNYNPTKHDDIVYGEPYQEAARDITLTVQGRLQRRKKRK
jgi:hypothetical protein